ncbi:hypothetical protein [Acinetobacter sp. MD2]|uniref:hypothetical protein n=1 Tax=Acinetobacter sp. MD2 TaxID=2600066 RepID=UPI002D1F40D4|nr:hypothetical protein [Acinetobacter sp. MD2]MEB3768011.1 hypothetical protein [Acinetobacter sp. MD2]
MSYQCQHVTLDLETDVRHQCSLHHTRDQHLIGIIAFQKSSHVLKWADLEYFRRRTEELSVIPLPDCINAMIIDIRDVQVFLDQETPILPWRLIEEECPIRIVVPQERLDYYIGIFEPTWLTTDLSSAISEIRDFMDMFVH